ncbi:hypothetical protein PC39_11487 [Salinisphaera sp. PC39]|uniref:DUF1302 domain-containing protein n=1 Tax=Salinisphaera sp. PC39 TaxID=1304156 RepID=UPI00333E6BD6
MMTMLRGGRAFARMAAAATLAVSGGAGAYSFDLGPFQGSLTNSVSVGAAVRMQERDDDLIGKSNLNPGLCLRRNDSGDVVGNTCNSTTDPSLNQAYVDAPGAYSVNGDDGNLNYDQYDLVSATAKLTSELSIRWGRFNFFTRGLGYFDEVNADFDEYHPDTTFQPRHTERPSGTVDVMAADVDLLDYYVSGSFPFIGNRDVLFRIGNQVVNWGESSFLLLNSINTINPPDAARLRLPGSQIAEVFKPLGIASFQTTITPDLTVEAFYNYDWEPVTPDPVGSFFSTSDVAGATDNRYAMLSFGKAPEDPDAIYDPGTNPSIPLAREGDPTGLISSASRTVYFESANEPEDGGQYGVSLRYFAPWLNNGTELGFYFMNYHSRFPLASSYAADETCLNGATGSILDLLGCGVGGDKGFLGLAEEPLPLDTMRLQLEYPEDIHLYGLSWNTTVGNWSFQGEYAYRPNLPLQIHTTDLVFASLQPAFPDNNVGVTVNGEQGLVVPNKRAAVPDYVETLYRGNTVTANQYIRGYERMKVGQFDAALTRTIGGSNWLKADQVIVLLEAGFNHVMDFPDKSELQFAGPGTNTHASGGADGTASSVGNDSATLSPNALPCTDACRQNPTTQDGGFADDFSWGYRFLVVPRYQNAIFGANLAPVLGIFHDVDGTTPGPGGLFVEDRVQLITALRWDYQNRWSGEVRYTAYTTVGDGDDEFHQERDRDYLSLFVAYDF